jgi:hypothetical protein
MENINTKDVATTYNTANIKMLDDVISLFLTETGQATPILIVARCKLDSIEYAALFDTSTSKCYAVEVVRENGEIKYFKDMDTLGRDEEWAVISNFFLDNNVYERNRIIKWIWNTRLTAALGGGIPKTTLERWDKKKYKRRKL